MKNFELFITEEKPNGTSDLLLVNEFDEVEAVIEDAVFGAISSCIRNGFGTSVYAETCGGYANQIHGAAYLQYSGQNILRTSNLEPYECECELCEEHGYEKSPCEMKDWSMIEYMDECYDGGKLYWIDLDAVFHYMTLSPVHSKLDRYKELLKYFTKNELKEAKNQSECIMYADQKNEKAV